MTGTPPMETKMGADEPRQVYETLTDADLLRLLETEEDRLPRAAMDESVRRAERMVELLTVICRDETAWRREKSGWQAIHATFILGAIGGERALPGLLSALVFADAHNVDWVCEALPGIVGSVGPVAVPDLKRIAADQTMSWTGRWLALLCLGAVAARNESERDAILDHIRTIAEGHEGYDVRGPAGMVLLDFVRAADRQTLECLGAELARDVGFIAPFVADDVAEAYDVRGQRFERYFRDWLRFYDPGEIDRRQERWRREDAGGEGRSGAPKKRGARGFVADLLRRPESGKAASSSAPDISRSPPPRRTAVGRNDPCPCGSGRKYKKCHGG